MPCCRRCRLIRWIIACLAALVWLVLSSPPAKAADATPQLLDVARLKHPRPVDFQREILPILRQNCLACHNAATAEGKLVLETPQTIAKGGDNGPAVVAKKPEQSLLLQRARGGGDGIMPPADNKVAAKNLTPEQLGIIKLWISQGAAGSVSAASETIKWQPLPSGMNPIYSVALTADGQFAACARANQIFIYQLPTGRLLGRLTDPALLTSGVYSQPGVADLDLIQSLAFNPDASLLASGGYRTIKLWRRSSGDPQFSIDKLAEASPLASSADGKWLAAADADHTVRLLEAATGSTRRKLIGHSGAIASLAFSADGTRLCTASLDHSLRLWSVPEGKLLSQLALEGPATAAVLIDGDKQVAAITGESRIWIGAWPAEHKLGAANAKDPGSKAADAAARYLTGHGKPVTALAVLHKNANQLVSAAADGQVILWDIASGKQVRQFQHGGPVAAIAVRPDDERMATAGLDGVTKLWNARDEKPIAELRGDLRATARVAAATRSATLAKNSLAESKAAATEAEKAAAAENENVKKATAALATAEKTLAEKQAALDKQAAAKKAADAAVAEVQAAQTKVQQAIAAAQQEITATESKQKKHAQLFSAAGAAAKKSPSDKVVRYALRVATQKAKRLEAKLKSSQAAHVAATKEQAQIVARLKPSTDAAAAVAKPLETAEQERKAAETAQKLASKALASATVAATKAKDRIPTVQAEIAAVEKRIAQADAEVAKLLATAKATESPVHCVAFSADGRELATGDAASRVHTWSAESGTPLNVYSASAGIVHGAAFAGEHRLAATAGGRATAWDTLSEWRWEKTLGAPGQLPVDRVTALDFSPDGKLLASGGGVASRSGELKLWNVSDGKLIRNLPNVHSDTVLGVRFSPDGALLATCGTDKFIKVLEIGSGKLVRAFEGHTHHVLGVSWQASGKTLASAGADNVVKVWDFASGEQKRTIQGFSKEVTSIQFLAETPDALATSGDQSVKIVRTSDGQTVRSFSGSNDFVYTGAASIDGRIIIAGGQDSVLRAYHADTGASLRSFDPPAPTSAAIAK